MLKMHIFAAITAILLAFGSPAAPVRLGLPSPIAAPGPLQTAAYGQGDPQIKSNGRGFLSVWVDLRRGTSELWATPLELSGGAIEPTGHPLAIPMQGSLAWKLEAIGTDYFLTYARSSGVFLVRLDDLGYAVDAPHKIGEVNDKNVSGGIIVAANGQNLAVAAFGFNQTPDVTFVARSGEVLAKVMYPAGETPVALMAIGGEYFSVTTSTNCAACVGLMKVTMQGIQRVSGPIASELYGASSVAAAAGGGNILVLISESPTSPNQAQNLRSYLIDTSGKRLATELIGSKEQDYNGEELRVVSDGRAFLVGYAGNIRNQDRVRLAYFSRRIRLDGSVFGDALESDQAVGFVFASCMGINIMEWARWATSSEYPHLVARRITSFDDLWSGSADPLIVTQSTPAQVDAQVIAMPLGLFAIWREPTPPRVLRAAIVGSTPFLVAPQTREVMPAVAASASELLVAWAEDSETGARIRARRYSFEGTSLDIEPFTIAYDATATENFASIADHVSVVSDGSSFLVLWPSEDRFIHSAVVLGGKPGRPQIVDMTNRGPIYQYAPSAVWTGTNYLVTWNEETQFPFGDSKFCCPRAVTYRALLSADGRAHDLTGVPVTNDVGYRAWSKVEALGSDRLAVAWIDGDSHGQCIKIVTATLDGTALAAPRIVTCSGLSIALAWSGGEFVMAWKQYESGGDTSIWATRFDQSLVPLDAAPFQVSPAGLSAFSPALTPIAAGVELSYSVFGTEDGYGGVARAFVRTLLREHEVVSPARPRKPAARH